MSRIPKTFSVNEETTDLFFSNDLKELSQAESKKIGTSNLYDFVYKDFKKKKQEIKDQLENEKHGVMGRIMKNQKFSKNLKKINKRVIKRMRKGNNFDRDTFFLDLFGNYFFNGFYRK